MYNLHMQVVHFLYMNCEYLNVSNTNLLVLVGVCEYTKAKVELRILLFYFKMEP